MTMAKNGGEFELVRQNDRLRQEVITLKEQLKVFKNRSKLSLNINANTIVNGVNNNHLNASRSKSKSNNDSYSPLGGNRKTIKNRNNSHLSNLIS